MLRSLFTATVAAAALAMAGGAGAQDLEIGTVLTGRAVALDGDTLLVGDERVRLFGIDAPEMSEQDGWFARAALDKLLADAQHQVQCVVLDEDRYGRPVAQCMAEGDLGDFGHAMILAGWAIPYRAFTYAAGTDACPDQDAWLAMVEELDAEDPDMPDGVAVATLAQAGCSGYSYDFAESSARLIGAGRWARMPRQ